MDLDNYHMRLVNNPLMVGLCQKIKKRSDLTLLPYISATRYGLPVFAVYDFSSKPKLKMSNIMNIDQFPHQQILLLY